MSEKAFGIPEGIAGGAGIGFARHMAAPKLTAPKTGFAQYAPKVGFSTTMERRKSAFAPEPEPAPGNKWPTMTVGWRFDMDYADEDWLTFDEELAADTKFGRAIPLADMMLKLYTPERMEAMFEDGYSKLERSKTPGGRARRARQIIKRVNTIIAGFLPESIRADASRYESPLLRERAEAPYDNELLLTDDGLTIAREEVTRYSWATSRFRTGEQEGIGPYGLGIHLPDEDNRLAEAAERIDTAIWKNTRLDTRGADRERLFVVQAIDTFPWPVAGSDYTLPRHPIAIPLSAPRAEIED